MVKYSVIEVLSKNLPADSIHSGFLHSVVHCLGQYRDNITLHILRKELFYPIDSIAFFSFITSSIQLMEVKERFFL